MQSRDNQLTKVSFWLLETVEVTVIGRRPTLRCSESLKLNCGYILVRCEELLFFFAADSSAFEK